MVCPFVMCELITGGKPSCGKVIFLQVSVILSSGGACMVFGGACMVYEGPAWLGWGHAWLPGGMCVGYDEIRSMGRRYALYWNAFLLLPADKVKRI